MPRYPTRGVDPESGEAVRVELGWAKGVGYFFGIDSEDGHELASGVELDLVDLIDRTRAYLKWDRRLLYAMRDAPLKDMCDRCPGSPAAQIILALR